MLIINELLAFRQKIQMLLKSTKGEIDVFLCPDPDDMLSQSESSGSYSIEDSCSSDSNYETSPSKSKSAQQLPSTQSVLFECRAQALGLQIKQVTVFVTYDSMLKSTAT